MPAPEQSGRTTTAVYWEYVATDKYGDVIWLQPVELCVKWNTTTRVIRSPNAEDVELTAELLVGQKLVRQSLLWKGSLKDWDPDRTDNELHQVVGYREAEDVKGRETTRLASLARFGGSLPPGSGT